MPQNNNKINTVKIAKSELLPEIIKFLGEGRSVTLRLHGNSMRPFLEDGRDKAILKPVEEIKTGDVVLAEIRPKRYVLHRIVSINGDDVRLLGDGNMTAEKCRRDSIKAIATGFYRKGRKTIDSTNGWKWRMYSWVWLRLRPIRRYLLFIYKHVFV